MKEASKVKQTTRQSNTVRPRQSGTFPKKNELPRVGLEPMTLHSRQSTLPLNMYSCISCIRIKSLCTQLVQCENEQERKACKELESTTEEVLTSEQRDWRSENYKQ